MSHPVQRSLSSQTPIKATKRPRYYAVPPVIRGKVAIGLEKFTDMKEEIRPLHAAHYAETETKYQNEDFNPNYEAYYDMEKDGRFVCFTVRLGWQMVAYLQYYVFRDVHTKDVLQAREDAFFVHPLARGNKIAPQLLAYAEDALKVLGCQYAGMTSKAPVGAPDIGPFLEKRGYKPVAVYYVKDLET
jgi:GNAT superfamily N-acetyltransferase